MNGTVYLGFDSEDLTDWGRLLDAIEGAEQEADLDEPFTADWPQPGRTAYLRLIADDPYVVEVHDGTSTQIVVSMPLDMGKEWTAESRQRLSASRVALGVTQRITMAHVPDPGLASTPRRLLDNDDGESVLPDESAVGCHVEPFSHGHAACVRIAAGGEQAASRLPRDARASAPHRRRSTPCQT
ncbi:DUF5959 family protein [Streptomyces sp. LN704]|uniref:DUF5959 family protein n=1 Tax=unclassified Streptomyces TaxID=2593676 RepID=UPI0037237516